MSSRSQLTQYDMLRLRNIISYIGVDAPIGIYGAERVEIGGEFFSIFDPFDDVGAAIALATQLDIVLDVVPPVDVTSIEYHKQLESVRARAVSDSLDVMSYSAYFSNNKESAICTVVTIVAMKLIGVLES